MAGILGIIGEGKVTGDQLQKDMAEKAKKIGMPPALLQSIPELVDALMSDPEALVDGMQDYKEAMDKLELGFQDKIQRDKIIARADARQDNAGAALAEHVLSITRDPLEQSNLVKSLTDSGSFSVNEANIANRIIASRMAEFEAQQMTAVDGGLAGGMGADNVRLGTEQALAKMQEIGDRAEGIEAVASAVEDRISSGELTEEDGERIIMNVISPFTGRTVPTTEQEMVDLVGPLGGESQVAALPIGAREGAGVMDYIQRLRQQDPKGSVRPSPRRRGVRNVRTSPALADTLGRP